MAQISWMEWGKEAFERADQEAKLILLWLTCSWCQWSREMERSTFVSPNVIDLVNDHYIPIRVDSGRRPDIDLRYNQGGLPSNVIVTSSGDLVSGGTYFTADHMALMLSRTVEYYRANQDEIIRNNREATEQLVAYERATVRAGAELDRAQVVAMMRSLLERSFDAEYGGFGVEPKFLRLGALTFLLHQFYYTGEQRCRDMVTKTLDVIGDSSLYDLEEGGVFRYSTTRDWNEPSSEKILEDNVGLLKLYLETYQLTGLDRYRAKAEDIVGYVTTTLMDRGRGGFYGSQASDDQYYLLPLDERSKREAPPVDSTSFASANGRAIASFFYAAGVLERPDLLENALRAAERLLEHSTSKGVSRYNDGTPRVPGLLVDQVPVALAWIALADATGGREHLAHAEALAEYMVLHLLDERDGKFRDAPEDAGALGNLKVVRKPFELNVEAARLMHELFLRTGNSRYDELAEKLLLALRQRYLDMELQGAGFAEAADYTARPAMVAKVIGQPDGSGTIALRHAAARPYYPKKMVRVVDPAQEPEEVSRAGLSEAALPVVIVCKGEGDAKPIDDPAEAARAVAARTAELREA